jgi:NAD(P)-dependent dehydrogenase (short-subunit alcohol dehydrogenase family)
MGRLDGKTALITGANSGIGFASAKRFIAEGARVAITGRRAEAVKKAAAELGPEATGIVADAGSIKDIGRLIDEVKQLYGTLDILFLNAGNAPAATIDRQDEASFDELFNVHVKGPYFTVQKALPLLKEGSSIIFTTSIGNVKGFPGFGVYAAAKAALRSFTRTLASELATKGIRVNSLSPGPIDTPIFGKTGLSQKEIDEFQKNIGSMVPLGRFGKADEIAAVAVFLASGDSSYITGSEITADGGMAQV